MQITIFGSGYVGLVTGACLAEVGNHVVCVDIDADKVRRLNEGEIPIFEPGLDDYIARNVEAGRLEFTTDVEKGIRHGLFLFVAVGTPPDEDGSADLQHVIAVARSIGQHLDSYRIIVDKSTVPVGTADKVRDVIRSELNERRVEMDFDVASNPEFLKEGAAIEDFMKPDRIVIGTDNPRTAELLRALYEPFNRNHERVITMDVRSAELTKYAANAMLATKISFMNELANIAERAGADIEKVRIGIGSDPRIGYQFIYPGAGYGGSCFPKDVRALARSAKKMGYKADLLDAVEDVNNRQKLRLFEKISAHFDGQLEGKTVAVWGLAFKPRTDDMREASSRALIETLWEAGARVRAYDPEAMDEARRIYGERDDFVLCEGAYEALDGADMLAIVTEWQEFRSPNFDRIRTTLSEPVVFDGRNLYDPGMLDTLGLTYYAIGRSNVASDAQPAYGRRKTDKMRGVACVLAFLTGAVLAPGHVDAQERGGWNLEPILRVGLETDDNAQLNPRTDEEIELEGVLLEAAANVFYDSRRTNFSMTPRVLVRNYPDEEAFDSDDLFFDSNWQHALENSRLGFRLYYDQQKVRTAEKADTNLDTDDPVDIPGDESGRVGSLGDRAKLRLIPTWDWQFGERSSIGAIFRYTDVTYDDVPLDSLTDYTDMQANLIYSFQYSPTTKALFSASARQYENDRTIDNDITGYGLLAGFEHEISNTTSLRVLAGAERSEFTNLETNTEAIGEILLRKQLETITLFAEYRRDVNATGSGDISLRDSISLNATRRLTEKISAGVGLRAYQAERLDVDPLFFEDQRYVQLRGRFTWYITPAFSAEFDYRYTFLDRDAITQEPANSNQLNLWLSYHPRSTPR